MKQIAVFFVLIAVLFASAPAMAESQELVNWVTLNEGTKKAKAENKPMIVDFFFDLSCPRCAMLEKNIYGVPKIAKKINADFVAIRIDLTKDLTKDEQALGEKFDFKNDCLLLFLDPKGKVYKDPKGKKLCFVEDLEPEIFISYLDMIKDRISAGKKP